MSEYIYSVTGNFKAGQTLIHIHKVFFGDAEYCKHAFYVSYNKHHQNQENAFMPKEQKIYTS